MFLPEPGAVYDLELHGEMIVPTESLLPSIGVYEGAVLAAGLGSLVAAAMIPTFLFPVLTGAVLGTLIYDSIPESWGRDSALADALVTGGLILLAGSTLGSLVFVASAGLAYSVTRILSRYASVDWREVCPDWLTALFDGKKKLTINI